MPPARKPGKHHQRLLHLIESGKFDEAMQLATALSRKHPHDADIWYMLAGLYAQRGRIEDVINSCKRVTTLKPDHAGAHYNLGAALLQTGDQDAAKTSFSRCLDIDPKNPAALVSVGKLLSNEGRYDEALPCFRKAAMTRPPNAEAYYCLGVAEQSVGDLDAATNAYRQAIRIHPNYHEASNNLGSILTDQGKLDQALEIFRKLVQLKPDAPEVLNNMGVVYESMGKMEEAESAYRSAISLDPSLAETKSYLGFLLAGEGRTSEALTYFKDALDCAPAYEPAIAGKAVALEKLGKIEDARATLDPVISAGTRNPDIVLAYCTAMLRKGEPGAAITIAEQLVASGNIPSKGNADLHFALGDLYEKTGDFATAFLHYRSANEASPCIYHHKKQVAYIDRIIDSSRKEILDRLPRADAGDRKIIFIVGMPRSGTSLVEQILASHPDVYGAGELRYIGDIAASFSPPGKPGEKYPAAFASLGQADVNRMARQYLDAVGRMSGSARLVTDKMPHNFLYLGLIRLLIPDARIIHISRTPLDNCLSLYFRGFSPMHSYTTDLGMLGQYYREYQRLMAHWRDNPNIGMFDIRYEDVVNDLEKSTRELLDFCGLDWADECINFHSSGRFVKTPSYDQVRRPIYTSSVEKWKHYRAFIAPLEAALGEKNTAPQAATAPPTRA